jgi:8-oxo-dGTP diphosphatase
MTKPLIKVVCAAIEDNGTYLITQRNKTAVFPLMWEFPGGKVEEGESDAEALVRELNHRLGIEAQVGGAISVTTQTYQAFDVRLSLYHVQVGPLPPKPLRVHDLAWVPYDGFGAYPFAPADEHAIASMLASRPQPH